MTIKLGYEGLIPYYYFDGATLYIPPDTSAGVVLGTEGYIENPGLTLGAWIKISTQPSGDYTNRTIISKMGVTGEFSYLFDLYTPGYLRFYISGDGGSTNIDVVQTGTVLPTNTWIFVVGRWDTSYMSVFVDTVKTSILSSQIRINNSPAFLAFGARANALYRYYFHGYMAYPFICAASLSDAIIENIYNKTKTLFGK